MAQDDRRRADAPIDAAVRALLWLALALPYRWRVPLVGWAMAHVVAPLAGWRQRVRENLAHVCPELPAAEVRRIQRQVADNAGRTLVEIYSGEEFARRLSETPLTGEGVEAFEAARAAGRPALLVTAHLGNFVAPRAVLFAHGHPLAGLYRPMRNLHFNEHYTRALASIGEPIYPSTRRGLAELLRHLRGGGIVGMLTDVHANDGAPLTFFGRTAPTALSAAELALRHDALIMPVYGIRQPDGLSFAVRIGAPVPHGDPRTMTQALNDDLEAVVRTHMGQWFWIHRRWKPERQRRRAAARMGP